MSICREYIGMDEEMIGELTSKMATVSSVH